jgi:hypothetical protein
MLTSNVYVLEMLVRDRHLALSRDSRVPSWERRDAALRRGREQVRGGRLRLLILRLRPAHSGS